MNPKEPDKYRIMITWHVFYLPLKAEVSKINHTFHIGKYGSIKKKLQNGDSCGLLPIHNREHMLYHIALLSN